MPLLRRRARQPTVLHQLSSEKSNGLLTCRQSPRFLPKESHPLLSHVVHILLSVLTHPKSFAEPIETLPVNVSFCRDSGLPQPMCEFFHQFHLVFWRKSFNLFFDFPESGCPWPS